MESRSVRMTEVSNLPFYILINFSLILEGGKGFNVLTKCYIL
jgi:hypothetical protein